MAQILVPTSTISSTGWTAVGAATHHECLDEGIDTPHDSDTTYVYTGAGARTLEVKLAAGTDPSDTSNHKIRIVWRNTKAGSSVNIEVKLLEGSTALTTQTATVNATSYAEWNYTLSSLEAGSIGAYNDFRIRIKTPLTWPAGNKLRDTACQLEIPSAGEIINLTALSVSESIGGAPIDRLRAIKGTGISESLGIAPVPRLRALSGTAVSESVGLIQPRLIKSLDALGISESVGFLPLPVLRGISSTAVSESLGTAPVVRKRGLKALTTSESVAQAELGRLRGLSATGVSESFGQAQAAFLVAIAATAFSESVGLGPIKRLRALSSTATSESLGLGPIKRLRALEGTSVSESLGHVSIGRLLGVEATAVAESLALANVSLGAIVAIVATALSESLGLAPISRLRRLEATAVSESLGTVPIGKLLRMQATAISESLAQATVYKLVPIVATSISESAAYAELVRIRGILATTVGETAAQAALSRLLGVTATAISESLGLSEVGPITPPEAEALRFYSYAMGQAAGSRILAGQGPTSRVLMGQAQGTNMPAGMASTSSVWAAQGPMVIDGEAAPASSAEPVTPRFGIENVPHQYPGVIYNVLPYVDDMLVGRNGLTWQKLEPTKGSYDFSSLDTEMFLYSRAQSRPRVVLTLIPQSTWGCNHEGDYDSVIHWSRVTDMTAWQLAVYNLCNRYKNVIDVLVIGEEAESKAQDDSVESDYEALLNAAFAARPSDPSWPRIAHSGTNTGVQFDAGIPVSVAAPIWTGGNYDLFSIHPNRDYRGLQYFVEYLRDYLGVTEPIMADDAGSVNGVWDHEAGSAYLGPEDNTVLTFWEEADLDAREALYRAHQPTHVEWMCEYAIEAGLSRVLFSVFFDSGTATWPVYKYGGMFESTTGYPDRPAMTTLRSYAGSTR